MKKRLFGQLGEKLKGNALTIVLGICVIAAGIFSYNTIKGINKQLENQHLQKIDATPSPAPSSSEEIKDVQEEQENVPLPAKPEKKDEKKEEKEEKETVEPKVTPKEKFVLPVRGKIYSAYSGDELVYNRTLDDWRTHNGVDVSASIDEVVHSGADGKVVKVYADANLGNVVEIDHGDFTARYCGLAVKTFVNEGDSVTQGQNIGTVSQVDIELAEQPHIHLEIIKDGKTVNPNEVLK